MFKRHPITLMSNPVCTKATEIDQGDFQYYDKDGFELNLAEQKFYSMMGFPIQNKILNHCCWQEPWFELEHKDQGLILDHSMFLCRCNYNGAALEQLQIAKKTEPLADYLIQTKNKWGFDFALDAIRDDTIFEVLHIEYDCYNYDNFKDKMIRFEWSVRHTDWHNAADCIWQSRDQWQNLQGFDQNNWKAHFLLGWPKAEYTQKSV